MLDLIRGGSSWPQVVTLAREIATAGATLINTGIGWHEARIPTIATMVPRAAFTWVTKKLRKEISTPLITSNRINTPEVAEAVLARGDADMVSMARPFLADAQFVLKAAGGRVDEINSCIACNQACLDHIFQGKVATCLVNPRACHETELIYRPVDRKKKIAVIGGGPAGLSCAAIAAERGHQVTLFEQADKIGGQLNMAVRIPGKEEFKETLRYFQHQLKIHRVDTRLGVRVSPLEIQSAGYEEVVVATGVVPRKIDIPGINHPRVLSYLEVLTGLRSAGKRVAIIGAGGIGFDVAVFLTHNASETGPTRETFFKEWGIDASYQEPGGLSASGPKIHPPDRQVYLLQRKGSKIGKNLGKTTGWIHRSTLKSRGVIMLNGVTYEQIDDRGLTIRLSGERQTLPVDSVVICAGQDSLDTLYRELKTSRISLHLIGGAAKTAELDAQSAIDQGCRLAANL